jgi:glycosyltransferase involved in cell wall biosynthesis
MRLILAITKLDAGGMERFCATLCNTLAAQGRACTVCALHPAAPGAARDWLSPEVSYVELNRPARFAAPALMRLCRTNPHDPVLALGVEICVVLVALKRLGLIRNPVIYRESTAVLAHCTPFWRWMMARFVSHADGLIVQSRQALADLGQLFAVRQPTALIRNPCALLQMASPIGIRLPGSRENLRLLSVGRLEGMKGHERLIRALPGLRRRFPGARLTIIGQGSLAEQLQATIAQLGLQEYVDLPGYTQHPEESYGKADLFVLPSFYEGLPNVVIEALAMGCPVIAAAGAGGTQELMEELGLGAFLVPDAEFVEQLPEVVEKVLASGRDVWERAQQRLAQIAMPAVVADQVWGFARGG